MKILVVEDDRKVAGFIEQGLKEEGYIVDVAPDGDEATLLAHVYDYDVILLDIVLPKKNGFQVATELRREGRNDAHPDADLARRGRGCGAGPRRRSRRLPGQAVPVRRAAGPDPGPAPAGRCRAAGGASLSADHPRPAPAHRDQSTTNGWISRPRNSSCWSTSCFIRRRSSAAPRSWRRYGTCTSIRRATWWTSTWATCAGSSARRPSEQLLATVRGVGFSLRRGGETAGISPAF